jgi:hypothetical protein
MFVTTSLLAAENPGQMDFAIPEVILPHTTRADRQAVLIRPQTKTGLRQPRRSEAQDEVCPQRRCAG